LVEYDVKSKGQCTGTVGEMMCSPNDGCHLGFKWKKWDMLK